VSIISPRSLALVLAFCLAGCASKTEFEPPRAASTTAPITRGTPETLARPPFYRIAGGDGATLALMGTIHIGPDIGWTFSTAINDGLEQADLFILEIDLNQVSEDEIGSALARMVIIEPPRFLRDLVSPETAKLLEQEDARLTKMGLPFNARKRFKPWYIATSLVEIATRGSGWSGSASAESVILAAIGERPIHGLEKFQEQLALLDNLDPNLQDMMLRDTLLGLDEVVEEVHAHAQAWRIGDETYFEELAQEGVDEMPGFERFYEILLGDRNRRWLPEFRRFLDDPAFADRLIFVGVGTLHLVGEDGLVDLFRSRGYQVERINHDERIDVDKR
jgi:uncharacterized protein YbaP (TraB family)